MLKAEETLQVSYKQGDHFVNCIKAITGHDGQGDQRKAKECNHCASDPEPTLITTNLTTELTAVDYQVL